MLGLGWKKEECRLDVEEQLEEGNGVDSRK